MQDYEEKLASNAFVASFWGLCLTSSVFPDSTIEPEDKTYTYSHTDITISISWEIKRMEIFVFFFISFNRFIMDNCLSLSKLARASSNINKPGFIQIARAMAIRCCSPPEHS